MICELGHTICGCSTCHYCEEGIGRTLEPADRCTTCRRTTCNCRVCTSCEEKRIPSVFCAVCNICSNCCDCQRCSSCDNAATTFCDDCHCCAMCCECRKVHYIDRGIVWHDSKYFGINPSKRWISLEPEIYSCTDFRKVDKVCQEWGMSIVADSSIGNSRNSFEINTSPAKGQAFIDQLNELGAALKNSKAEVTSSCGCHVHVGIEDLNFWDIRRLIDLYSKIENALFDIVARDRRSSRFCIPCGKEYFDRMALELKRSPKDIKSAFSKTIYGEDKKTIVTNRIVKYNDARYKALNLHSFTLRNTLESRILHGTINPEEMINWGILWAGIIDYAVTHPNFKGLPDDPLECLIEVAPTPLVRDWITRQYERFSTSKKTIKKKARPFLEFIPNEIN